MVSIDEIHAVHRAKERYGVDLTMGDLRDMEQQCLDPRTLMGHRNGREIHLVEHRPTGKAMKAVFAPHDGIIVTFAAPNHGLRPQDDRYGKRRIKLKGRCGRRHKRSLGKHS